MYQEVDTTNVIATSGISKGYGMAAMRLGFLAGHPDLLKAAAMVKMEITKIHTNLLAQYGALAALKDHQYLRDAEKVIRRNLNYVVESVADWQSQGYDIVIPVMPEYGFSMVFDISKMGVTAQEICVALFKRHVAVYAGDGLGDVGASEYIRINMSRSDLWAYETLCNEMIPAVKEAQSGVYGDAVASFFEEGRTKRGLRIAAEIRNRK